MIARPTDADVMAAMLLYLNLRGARINRVGVAVMRGTDAFIDYWSVTTPTPACVFKGFTEFWPRYLARRSPYKPTVN
jgi:hypothetical protein